VALITNPTDTNPQSRDQNDLDYKIIFNEIDGGSSVVNAPPLQIHHVVREASRGRTAIATKAILGGFQASPEFLYPKSRQVVDI
jgi:hypothetical protein